MPEYLNKSECRYLNIDRMNISEYELLNLNMYPYLDMGV